jgi:hypothetical protein
MQSLIIKPRISHMVIPIETALNAGNPKMLGIFLSA